MNLARYVGNGVARKVDALGLASSSPCESQSGANEDCEEISGPAQNMEEDRTYIGDKWSLYFWENLPYYKTTSWVYQGSATTSNCSDALNTSITTSKGEEITYSIGGLVNGFAETFEISGSAAFSSSTGQAWTQNFNEPAQPCYYYKGYLARLMVTIEYHHPSYQIQTGYGAGMVWTTVHAGYSTVKTLYTDTGSYVCKCKCSKN